MFGRCLVVVGMLLILLSAWIMPMNSFAFADDPPGTGGDEEALGCSPAYCALSPGTCAGSIGCAGTCRTSSSMCNACTTCDAVETNCYCFK